MRLIAEKQIWQHIGTLKLRKLRVKTGKGDRPWETRGERRIRKRVRNRTPKNSKKRQKRSWISKRKEPLADSMMRFPPHSTSSRSLSIMETAYVSSCYT
jgi:hypothetical protein